MKIETLKDRIAKATDKIAKKESTVSKKTALIEKKTNLLETLTDKNEIFWTECDIRHLGEDIDRLQKEIRETRVALDGYREQYAAELEKAASRNVPAIVNFLENWKRRVFSYYDMGLEPCYKMKAEIKAAGVKLRGLRYGSDEYEEALKPYYALKDEYDNKVYGYFENVPCLDYFGRPSTKREKVADGEWEYIRPYDLCDTYEQATARLNADLTEEANRKYDFIIERVNAICGKITDASGLKVGAKGDLNGYIIGERGTAHVQTIGAGGYNIQCYHFRTLIHKAK